MEAYFLKMFQLVATKNRDSGADPGFQGRLGGWFLGTAESMGHVPKMLQFEN